jgi:hypothetical protein
VPSAGVVKEGLLDNTAEPVPVDVVVPVPPLRTGSVPVTPVVKGNPVALVSTTELGVSKAGVVREGLVASTTAPVPVVLAADTAVPLPSKIPLTVVLRVIAGVVVELATVPARPLAETTETLVTVPIPGSGAEMTSHTEPVEI